MSPSCQLRTQESNHAVFGLWARRGNRFSLPLWTRRESNPLSRDLAPCLLNNRIPCPCRGCVGQDLNLRTLGYEPSEGTRLLYPAVDPVGNDPTTFRLKADCSAS